MMDVREDWIQWFLSFFDKKSAKGSGIKTMPNQNLADERHKPTIR